MNKCCTPCSYYRRCRCRFSVHEYGVPVRQWQGLPLSQQCDRTPQCLDQSDEGKCSGLLTVVCLEPSRCFILSYSYYEVKLTCSNFIWANQPIKIECQVRTAVGSLVSHKGDTGSISALCASDSIFNSTSLIMAASLFFLALLAYQGDIL